MKILELYSGTQSISKVFRQGGHEAYTIDLSPEFKPNLELNMLDFDIKLLPKEWREPDIIWASPPCTTFSVMSIGHYWKNGRPKHYKTFIGLALAIKAIQIIQELRPKYWFIENPVGMLRKQHFMEVLPRKTVHYCQYGEKYQKPTDIWSNASGWIPRKRCKNGDPCHEPGPRGNVKTGVQSLDNNMIRGIIPKELCKEILLFCEGGAQVKQQTL